MIEILGDGHPGCAQMVLAVQASVRCLPLYVYTQ
jgi:hypothetical protein